MSMKPAYVCQWTASGTIEAYLYGTGYRFPLQNWKGCVAVSENPALNHCAPPPFWRRKRTQYFFCRSSEYWLKSSRLSRLKRFTSESMIMSLSVTFLLARGHKPILCGTFCAFRKDKTYVWASQVANLWYSWNIHEFGKHAWYDQKKVSVVCRKGCSWTPPGWDVFWFLWTAIASVYLSNLFVP